MRARIPFLICGLSLSGAGLVCAEDVAAPKGPKAVEAVEAVEETKPTVRGTLVFGGEDTEMRPMAHWNEFPWAFEAQRWGRYWVEVSYYGLQRAIGVQARLRTEEERAKGFLKAGGTKEEPKTVRLGKIYVPAHGEHELVLFTPQDDPMYEFEVASVHLVPAPEGEEIAQAESGGIELLAKDATTYSEKMRYEPKEEKNCLGFWVSKDDYARWEFEVTKPGTFAAEVVLGCGKGNGGSEVAVEIGEQRNTFVVKDTGGFQNWESVGAGEFEIADAGKYFLTIKPVTQTGKAVMDVQKIVLKRLD